MIVNRICGMCQGGCQVNVTIEDGKIVRVEPDKASAKGHLCVRGGTYPGTLVQPGSSYISTYPEWGKRRRKIPSCHMGRSN